MTARLGPVRRVFHGADGNRLVADCWGTGAPVLLLHGGGQTRHSWGDTARRLAQVGSTAIALDLRGHGDSDWSADRRYGMQTHVADLHAVLAELGSSPALVGASMGGIASLLAVGHAPEGGQGLARCLVLVDVTPQVEESGITRIRQFMTAAPDGFSSLDEAAAAVAAYLPGRSRPRSASGLAKNLRRGEDGRYRWHWDPQILEGLSHDPASRHAALVQAARAVRIPTLLVRGGLSDVVSHDGAEELRRLIPHAQVTEVPGAGHMVAGDDNDSFTDEILEFVARY